MPSEALFPLFYFLVGSAYGLRIQQTMPTELTVEGAHMIHLKYYEPLSVGGQNLHFRSVIPVLGSSEGNSKSYIAFLLKYDHHLWQNLTASRLHCEIDGGDSREVNKFGGETSHLFKRYMVLHCPWPQAAERKGLCHNVHLISGEDRVSVEACEDQLPASPSHRPEGKKLYKLAACISEPLYHDRSRPEASGILLLPQWLEYYAKRGVEHFFVYVLPGSASQTISRIVEPYAKQGMISLLDASLGHESHFKMDFSSRVGIQAAQDFFENDCLYRAKSKADFLIPTIDADEYFAWDDIPSRLLQYEGSEHYALTFGRYLFSHPSSVYDSLQIESKYRQKALSPMCPKFILRPEVCHTLFIHWPTSWDAGYKQLGLPASELKVAHFRTVKNVSSQNVIDEHFSAQASQMRASLKDRYGVEWPELSRSIAKQVEHEMTNNVKATSFLQIRAQSDGSEVMQHALGPEFYGYIQEVNNLQTAKVIRPPSHPSSH